MQVGHLGSSAARALVVEYLAEYVHDLGQVGLVGHDLADVLVGPGVFIDEGPTIKRWRPRAQGRAFPIHKPMTHITIVVADREA